MNVDRATRTLPSRRDALALGAALLLPCLARSKPTGAYPAYRPQVQVAGTIRIWGHGSRKRSYVGALVEAWAAGFRQHHPQVQFEVTLRGDSTAIGGLYTGKADLALMERTPMAIELDGYRPIFGHDPFGVSVATGSLTQPDHALAPVVFVHRSNPLNRLTLQQLDAIIGADRRRGHPGASTWGDLHVTGPCERRPINVLVDDIASEIPEFLEQAVMQGSQKWTGRLREFGDPAAVIADGVTPGRRIMQALQKDPCGLAIATWSDATPHAKAIALSAAPSGPYAAPTRDAVAQRRYPLVRTVQFFVERVPGRALDPRFGEFLSYVLSEQGQAAIARDGGYYPLPPEVAAQARESLA